MTDKSATEQLREMLEECGVEYETDDRNGLRETIWCGTAAFQLSPTAKMTMIATPEQAIAATLGSEFNPDGLPVGLTISDDGNLLNWRGENYVKQSTLGSGTLTAEQVRKTVEKHWHDLPAEYDMPEAAALPEFSYDWHAIADELNSRAERTCHIVKNSRKYVLSDGRELFDDGCSICNGYVGDGDNYCSNCGARIVGE